MAYFAETNFRKFFVCGFFADSNFREFLDFGYFADANFHDLSDLILQVEFTACNGFCEKCKKK